MAQGRRSHEGRARHAGPARGRADAAVGRNPVGGMRVRPVATLHRAAHGAVAHRHRLAGCRPSFIPDTGRCLRGANRAVGPTAGPEGAVCACPMRPKIRRDRPRSLIRQNLLAFAYDVPGSKPNRLDLARAAPESKQISPLLPFCLREVHLVLALGDLGSTEERFRLFNWRAIRPRSGYERALLGDVLRAVSAVPPEHVQCSLRRLHSGIASEEGSRVPQGDLLAIPCGHSQGHADRVWTLGAPLVAGVLCPARGILLSPATAATATGLSCVGMVRKALGPRGTRIG